VLQLNPTLKEQLVYNDRSAEDVCNVLRGVMSGFNVDDINYYIAQDHKKAWRVDATEKERADHQDLLTAIACNVCSRHAYIGWMASPETLEHIKEQLMERPGAQTVVSEYRAQRDKGMGGMLFSLNSRLLRRP
jgi:hypothetical protein